MTTDPETRADTSPRAGRPIVLEPLPAGWWRVIGGTVLAALGPLFGFLVGSMVGIGDGSDPLLAWLLVGFLVGGVGIALALLGARTVYRNRAVEAPESGEGRPG
jgi:hypothetical protein